MKNLLVTSSDTAKIPAMDPSLLLGSPIYYHKTANNTPNNSAFSELVQNGGSTPVQNGDWHTACGGQYTDNYRPSRNSRPYPTIPRYPQ